MGSFTASLFISLLATCVSHAASPVTVALTRIQKTGTSLKAISDTDRARLGFLVNGTSTTPATNANSEYTTRVGIGNPPTYYDLVVDTGSSNTFCGNVMPYNRTSTRIPTGQAVNVSYGSGYFTGLEYLDHMKLAHNLVITNQSIGDALTSHGFEGYEGIIGLGPVGLTNGTLSPDKNATIPTVMNNLASQGLIEKQVLGVYFSPPRKRKNANSTHSADGALTYGGIDSNLYRGNVTYVPVTKTHPAAYYWGINITSATYVNNSIISDSVAGVVDTGTSLIYLASNFFLPYLEALPGATIDFNSGLMMIPNSSVPSMKPFNFEIGGRKFTLDAAAQLFTEEETKPWGAAGQRYGVINDMGHPSGRGFDFILGKKFMERFYAVFDTDNHRVGFAFTNHTSST